MKGYRKIHHIAKCQNCEWDEEDYNLATIRANKHFKETGHTIDLEIGLWKQLKKEDGIPPNNKLLGILPTIL